MIKPLFTTTEALVERVDGVLKKAQQLPGPVDFDAIRDEITDIIALSSTCSCLCRNCRNCNHNPDR
jgi:hypothetical protein